MLCELPLRRIILTKGRNCNRAGPVGLLGTKAFLCPEFLVFRKWASLGLLGLP